LVVNKQVNLSPGVYGPFTMAYTGGKIITIPFASCENAGDGTSSCCGSYHSNLSVDGYTFFGDYMVISYTDESGTTYDVSVWGGQADNDNDESVDITSSSNSILQGVDFGTASVISSDVPKTIYSSALNTAPPNTDALKTPALRRTPLPSKSRIKILPNGQRWSFPKDALAPPGTGPCISL
jgi:hypothetical protein